MQIICFQKQYPDINRKLPVYEKIRFNKEVSLVDYSSEDQVEIHTSDGEIFKANHVIVTVSLGVLKENHKNFFRPELSIRKQRCIQVDYCCFVFRFHFL